MISNVLENLPYIFAFLAGLIFLQQMIASFQATIVENTEMKPAIIFSVLIDGIFILLYIYTTTPPSSSGSLFVAAAGIGQALLLLFFIAFSFVYLFFRVVYNKYICN
jgi:phosphate/sulfate permease